MRGDPGGPKPPAKPKTKPRQGGAASTFRGARDPIVTRKPPPYKPPATPAAKDTKTDADTRRAADFKQTGAYRQAIREAYAGERVRHITRHRSLPTIDREAQSGPYHRGPNNETQIYGIRSYRSAAEKRALLDALAANHTVTPESSAIQALHGKRMARYQELAQSQSGKDTKADSEFDPTRFGGAYSSDRIILSRLPAESYKAAIAPYVRVGGNPGDLVGDIAQTIYEHPGSTLKGTIKASAGAAAGLVAFPAKMTIETVEGGVHGHPERGVVGAFNTIKDDYATRYAPYFAGGTAVEVEARRKANRERMAHEGVLGEGLDVAAVTGIGAATGGRLLSKAVTRSPRNKAAYERQRSEYHHTVKGLQDLADHLLKGEKSPSNVSREELLRQLDEGNFTRHHDPDTGEVFGGPLEPDQVLRVKRALQGKPPSRSGRILGRRTVDDVRARLYRQAAGQRPRLAIGSKRILNQTQHENFFRNRRGAKRDVRRERARIGDLVRHLADGEDVGMAARLARPNHVVPRDQLANVPLARYFTTTARKARGNTAQLSSRAFIRGGLERDEINKVFEHELGKLDDIQRAGAVLSMEHLINPADPAASLRFIDERISHLTRRRGGAPAVAEMEATLKGLEDHYNGLKGHQAQLNDVTNGPLDHVARAENTKKRVQAAQAIRQLNDQIKEEKARPGWLANPVPRLLRPGSDELATLQGLRQQIISHPEALNDAYAAGLGRMKRAQERVEMLDTTLDPAARALRRYLPQERMLQDAGLVDKRADADALASPTVASMLDGLDESFPGITSEAKAAIARRFAGTSDLSAPIVKSIERHLRKRAEALDPTSEAAKQGRKAVESLKTLRAVGRGAPLASLTKGQRELLTNLIGPAHMEAIAEAEASLAAIGRGEPVTVAMQAAADQAVSAADAVALAQANWERALRDLRGGERRRGRAEGRAEQAVANDRTRRNREARARAKRAGDKIVAAEAEHQRLTEAAERERARAVANRGLAKKAKSGERAELLNDKADRQDELAESLFNRAKNEREKINALRDQVHVTEEPLPPPRTPADQAFRLSLLEPEVQVHVEKDLFEKGGWAKLSKPQQLDAVNAMWDRAQAGGEAPYLEQAMRLAPGSRAGLEHELWEAQNAVGLAQGRVDEVAAQMPSVTPSNGGPLTQLTGAPVDVVGLSKEQLANPEIRAAIAMLDERTRGGAYTPGELSYQLNNGKTLGQMRAENPMRVVADKGYLVVKVTHWDVETGKLEAPRTYSVSYSGRHDYGSIQEGDGTKSGHALGDPRQHERYIQRERESTAPESLKRAVQGAKGAIRSHYGGTLSGEVATRAARADRAIDDIVKFTNDGEPFPKVNGAKRRAVNAGVDARLVQHVHDEALNARADRGAAEMAASEAKALKKQLAGLKGAVTKANKRVDELAVKVGKARKEQEPTAPMREAFSFKPRDPVQDAILDVLRVKELRALLSEEEAMMVGARGAREARIAMTAARDAARDAQRSVRNAQRQSERNAMADLADARKQAMGRLDTAGPELRAEVKDLDRELSANDIKRLKDRLEAQARSGSTRLLQIDGRGQPIFPGESPALDSAGRPKKEQFRFVSQHKGAVNGQSSRAASILESQHVARREGLPSSIVDDSPTGRMIAKLAAEKPDSFHVRARTEALRDELGVAANRPAYMPHERFLGDEFGTYTVKGIRAAAKRKHWGGVLMDIGYRTTDPRLIERAAARNIRNRMVTEWVVSAMEHHSVEVPEWFIARMGKKTADLTVAKEYARHLGLGIESGRGKSKFVLVNPGRASGVLLRDLEEGEKALIEHNGTTPSMSEALRQVAYDPSKHKGHPIYEAQGGWQIMERNAADEMLDLSKSSNWLARGWAIHKGLLSRALLTMGNVPWLIAQVTSNGMLLGLSGAGPFSVIRAHNIWKNMDAETRASLDPMIGVEELRFDLHKPQMAASVNNGFYTSWRGFRQMPWFPTPKGGVRFRPISALNDAMLKADRVTSNAMRRGALYKGFQREQIARMDRSLTGMARTQAKLMAHLKGPTEDQIRGMVANRHIVEEHAQHVLDFMGDYNKMTNLERRYLGQMVMFYGWLRFSLQFAFWTMPVRHPLAYALAFRIGEAQRTDIQRLLGTNNELPFQLGYLYYRGEHGEVREVKLAQLNPLLNQAVTFLNEGSDPRQLIGMTSPLVALLLDDAYLKSSFTGRAWRLGDSTADAKSASAGDRAQAALSQVLSLSAGYRTAAKVLGEGRPQSTDSLPVTGRVPLLRYLGGEENPAYKKPELKRAVQKNEEKYRKRGALGTVLHQELSPILPQESDIEERLKRQEELHKKRKRKPPTVTQRINQITSSGVDDVIDRVLPKLP
jgi:hypothetical protein